MTLQSLKLIDILIIGWGMLTLSVQTMTKEGCLKGTHGRHDAHCLSGSVLLRLQQAGACTTEHQRTPAAAMVKRVLVKAVGGYEVLQVRDIAHLFIESFAFSVWACQGKTTIESDLGGHIFKQFESDKHIHFFLRSVGDFQGQFDNPGVSLTILLCFSVSVAQEMTTTD